MVSYVVNRVKALVFTILNLFKRILCLFQRRRRKPSGDVIITGITVDGGNTRSNNQPEKLVPWNSWDENIKPATVEDHIEQYRKSLAKLRTTSEEIAHEPDFFNDMTPEIKTSNSLKLNFRSHPSPTQKVSFEIQENFSPTLLASPELSEIVDDEEDMANVNGWDADADDISEVLKMQRMEERRKRSEVANQKRAYKDRFVS